MDNRDMRTEELERSRMTKANIMYRADLCNRKRIVIKVGSSSLQHQETGRLDYHRIDRLAREISDLKNRGKDVILVSSGATATGREALGRDLTNVNALAQEIPMNYKQACAAVGQARLMMIYQKSFDDYNHLAAQVLMDKADVANEVSKRNLHDTLTELLALDVIPIINENDSVATAEFTVGDNDNLSAIVASLMGADLLILLSDINGLYTDDPRTNQDARFIEFVPQLSDRIAAMGKGSTGSASGTGGMSTKIHAARIATSSGADMIIVNSDGVDGMQVIHKVVEGENIGTLFCAEYQEDFCLADYIAELG